MTFMIVIYGNVSNIYNIVFDNNIGSKTTLHELKSNIKTIQWVKNVIVSESYRVLLQKQPRYFYCVSSWHVYINNVPHYFIASGEKQPWAEPDLKKQCIATEDSPLAHSTSYTKHHTQYTLTPADITKSKTKLPRAGDISNTDVIDDSKRPSTEKTSKDLKTAEQKQSSLWPENRDGRDGYFEENWIKHL